jgi:hypothetical protein
MTMRITEIIIEKSERTVIRQPHRKIISGWCVACSAEVQMLTPEVAARTASVSTRTIYRWIEAGRIHFIETEANELFICLDSLLKKSV